jgi:hypothetical protein
MCSLGKDLHAQGETLENHCNSHAKVCYFYVRVLSRNCLNIIVILKGMMSLYNSHTPPSRARCHLIEICNISVWVTWTGYMKFLYMCPFTSRLKVSGDCHCMVRWFNCFQTISFSPIRDAYVSCLLELSLVMGFADQYMTIMEAGSRIFTE